jgi:HEAT repeat protein
MNRIHTRSRFVDSRSTSALRASTRRAVVLGACLAAFLSRSAGAQSLASRVDAAPDGRVQFSFAARPGVCGNGRTFYSTGPNNFTGTFYGSTTDRMLSEACVSGPVRVVIDRADKLPLSVQAYVGPMDTTQRGTTDLGRVRAQDAADYLLALASKAEGRAGREAIGPALLADSANTAQALVAIARNNALPRDTRRAALTYMGRSTDGMQTIPASVTEPILAIARDETDNQSVRQGALQVLGRLDHGAGIPSLIQLSEQTQSTWLAKEAMQTLANSGDPRAHQYIRTAVRRTDLPDEVLVAGLRALGGQYATAQDAALLRELYPTLKSDRARDAVFSALAEMGGSANTKWLLDLAQSGDQPISLRRRALEASSRSGASVNDLVKLYDTTTDPGTKETLISLFVRSGEKPAVDKLLSIVKGEENPTVRRNAIAQLARSDDPRIKQALSEIVVR